MSESFSFAGSTLSVSVDYFINASETYVEDENGNLIDITFFASYATSVDWNNGEYTHTISNPDDESGIFGNTDQYSIPVAQDGSYRLEVDLFGDAVKSFATFDQSPDVYNVIVAAHAATGQVITGTAQADVVIGSAFDDVILTLGGMNQALGYGGADTITGGEDDDMLDGGAGDDVLYGMGGNDTLYGGAGADILTGGAGDDVLDGGPGDDTLAGGTGNDTYYVDSPLDVITEGVGEGNDIVHSTAPNYTLGANIEQLTLDGVADINGTGNNLDNTITGNIGSNYLSGGDGNDVLDGGGAISRSPGLDTLDGGAGNDTLIAGSSPALMIGGAGNDRLIGNDPSDTASYAGASGPVTVDLSRTTAQNTVGAGVDTLTFIDNLIGSDHNDVLLGNAAANILDGGAGNDTLDAGAGNDIMRGGAGNDGFRGGVGADVYDGGADIDVVNFGQSTGVNVFLDGSGTNGRAALGDSFVSIENLLGSQTGSDFLVGSADANRLTGQGGDDILWGRAGDDLLEGGDGNDRLVGQEGNDVLVGGAGADTFAFTLAPADGGLDRTNDFVAGTDKIEIDASMFGGGLVAGGPAPLVTGANPSSAGFASGVFLYNTLNGFLSWDADGQGAGAAVSFFRLQNLPSLTAADFSVVA